MVKTNSEIVMHDEETRNVNTETSLNISIAAVSRCSPLDRDLTAADARTQAKNGIIRITGRF